MCETKYCRDCNQTLPVAEFTSDKRKPDGLCTYCRKCMYARNKRYKAKNPDRAKESDKRWKEKNQDVLRIYALLNYYANQTEKNSKNRDYYSRNRDSLIAYQMEYRAENEGRLIQYRKARYPQIKARQYCYNVMRDRKLEQRSFPHQRKAIIEFYRNCPKGFHVDHIVPVAHPLVSGLHVLANLQYLPAKENMKKSNRFTIE